MLLHLLVTSLAERIAQPLETLVKTVSGCSASGLDVLERIRHWYYARMQLVLTHARCLREWRPSLSVISAAFIAF